MKHRLSLAAMALIGACAALPAMAQQQPAPSDQAAPNSATKSPDAMTQAPLARGKNSFTQAQARARLEKAGYTQVTGLTLDQDGLWQARAMRGGQWVNAAVDYKGDVAAR
jgi:hypothetical protein